MDQMYLKDQTMKLLNSVVRSWLELFDTSFHLLYSETAIEKRIRIYLDVISTVLEHYPEDSTFMLVPVVIYADKYVKRQGIHHTQVFYLLLASAICTIKYWDDTAASVNKSISLAFNYPLKSVNDVEKSFLRGLKWDMSLRWEEVEEFFNKDDHQIAVMTSSVRMMIEKNEPTYLREQCTLR